MQRDSRLEWIQTNRSKRNRMCHVAAPIRRIARLIGALGDAQAAEAIAARLAGVVDEAFRTHCRIALPDERTLLVSVDRPALVYAMRAQWLYRLGEALSGVRRRIVFEYGSAGARLAKVEEQGLNKERLN